MKLILSTAVAAVLATGAFANDLYINQIGTENRVGSENKRALQAGNNNLMDIAQSGVSNEVITYDAGDAQQLGNGNDMDIDQTGRDNGILRASQDGNGHGMTIKQNGRDNYLSNVKQFGGNGSDALIRQIGNGNGGSMFQRGSNNDADILQDGNNNDFLIRSGGYGVNNQPDGECYGCTVTLRQYDNNQYANVWQSGTGQNAIVTQTVNGNISYTHQTD